MYYITINKLIEIRKPTRQIIMNNCAQYAVYICKEGETEARRIATITKINTHKWELKTTTGDTRNAESLNDAIEILNEMFMYEYEMENAYNGKIKTETWKW